MAEERSRTPRLVADVMLGRLAKWLRLLGYDTIYSNSADDATLLRIAQAEDRILLTRDRALSRQRGVRSLWIESQELASQVRQVRAFVGTSPDGQLTRCAVCNVRLEWVAKADVARHVPLYVFQTQDEFRRCGQCGRIFWAATHVENMQAILDDLP